MLLELLKSAAAQNASQGNSSTNESDYVTLGTLRALLWEMFGTSQAGLAALPGIGSSFPGGETLTGTIISARTVDATSTPSAAAATANLKSFVVPAATPQVLGLGTLAVPGVRGLWFYASGTTSAAANVKTITVGFGGSAQQVIVPIATTVVSPWSCFGTVLTRSNTSVVLSGYGGTNTSAGASFQAGGVDLAVTGLTLTAAQTLQFQGTSAAAGAGDTVQDTLIVGYIP
jgi:hypothetical protein